MRILFLAFELPYPLDRGGRIKTYHLIEGLSRHHQVTLVALIRSPAEARNIEALRPFCEKVHAVPISISWGRKLCRGLASLLRPEPFVVRLYHSREMRDLVEALLKEETFDVLYADHFHMAQYIPENWPSVKVLDQHNVESVILQRFFENQRFEPMKLLAWLEWRKMRQYEPRMCRKFDRILTVTDIDAEIMRPWLPSERAISVIPIGVDTTYFQPQEGDSGSRELVSVGTMYWKPNIEGVLWFHRAVYPLVKKRVPEVKLTIVGTRPPAEIMHLAGEDGIEVTGWVEDARPYMARSAAMIVPLQVGSGMRVKILNALAMGLPVVSTSVGCEGIEVTHGEEILIADEPHDFAQATIRLLSDEGLRRKLSRSGRALVEERYSWPKVYAMIEAFCAEIERELLEKAN